MRRGLDDLALLLMRLGLGLGMALTHGLPKVQGLMSGDTRFVEAVAQMGFPHPLLFAWLSALAELVGGACVALGLFTRWFAAASVFNMGVAAFLRHHAHRQLQGVLGLRTFPEEMLKAWGRPELALVYLLGFTAILLMGAGALSMDGLLVGRRPKGKGRR
jgi:putative oxidoreductase